MKLFLILLILNSYSAFASKKCLIGVTKTALRYSPHMETYLEDVFMKNYQKIGLDCEIFVAPGKRIEKLEKDGFLSASAARINTEYMKDHYYRFPFPIAKDLDLMFVAHDINRIKKVGIIRGNHFQEELVNKFAPNSKKVYISSLNSLLKMFYTKRIDGFYTLPSFLKNNLAEKEYLEIFKNSKSQSKINFYHYIRKDIVKKHPEVIDLFKNEIKNKKFNITNYIRNYTK